MPPKASVLFGLVTSFALTLNSGRALADEACVPASVTESLAATLSAPLHPEPDYAAARAALEAADLPKAATLLRRLALQGVETPVGVFSMQLYLEALNRRGNEGVPACYDDMARDVPTFLDLYCTAERAPKHPEACDTLESIQVNLLRLRAEQFVRDAERKNMDADASYEAAGDLYLDIWTRFGAAACLAKAARCQRMDEILYNAARAYQAARRPPKALATRKILLDPRYNLDRGELAHRTRYDLGGTFQAIGNYDEAATWYEDFARMSPKEPQALAALQDAVILRLALGQSERAIANADLFNKQYGAKSPEKSARVAFAVAQTLLERDDLAGAKKRFEASMAAIDRNATIDVQIRSHAALGQVLQRLGKAADAAAEYGKVRAAYRDPEAVVRRLQDLDEGLRDRTLGTILTAVGEAMFFSAEEKRRAADKLVRPNYTGTGETPAVTGYFAQQVAGWLTERRQAVDEAEKAYVEILHLQPAPPPKWVVKAAARVARMHGKLAAELRSTPLPKAWKATGASPWGTSWEEVRGGFTSALEGASEPLYLRAKAAYRSCVDYSAKYAYGDADTRACADWLSRHYPAEYPRLDELTPQPWRTSSPFVPAPAPRSTQDP